MLTDIAEQAMQPLEIIKDEAIDAPIDVVFETLLEQLGPLHQHPDGSSLSMKLEAWPGGRWYRDLGNNMGHFWGHVQAIKRPTLLEICGPLFMSYPVTSNVQYRLTDKGGSTRLQFTHRAVGQIPAEVREGLGGGWATILQTIRQASERHAASARPRR